MFLTKESEFTSNVNKDENKEEVSSSDFSLKSVCLLGSTGSIGRQTLDVIRNNPSLFTVHSISGYSNISLLIEQIEEFSPKAVAVKSGKEARLIENKYGSNIRVFYGDDSTSELVRDREVDIVVVAIVGFYALPPLLSAINAGKNIAIANKESLVAAAPLVRRALKAANGSSFFVPVDSEHNSIYQALKARPGEKPQRIFITASGGPFLNRAKEELLHITPEEAIKHPRWNMGAKISVDSATLMNKALEVLEASVLFNLPSSSIEVLVHPQSLVHGIVEYADGTSVAVMYEPDMRVPILNALSECSGMNKYKLEKLYSSTNVTVSSSGNSWLRMSEARSLEFYPVDTEQFPSMRLVREVMNKGGYYPLIFNAANEIAVDRFINGRISFTRITEVIQNVLEKFLAPSDNFEDISLESLLETELHVREFAESLID
ncbi:MAG TPA: 1-deoxy-D-xylulose-5-phosphate reductoisomerase [Oligoflexia bacterium]|nr:1-deoxy-D-xylulose-5-phosphate reductoisomerase [Oligoflexia bacterium]HMP47270.1 1-deoxy-D-xylulose-5-phosphate reductoisomerase [Oligoflexia bacterium]